MCEKLVNTKTQRTQSFFNIYDVSMSQKIIGYSYE